MRSSGQARGAFGGGVAALLAISLAACTVASETSPGPSIVDPSSSGTQRSLPLATGPDSTLVLPPWTPEPELTDTPEPPLPKGTLPTVGAAPAGTWKAIKWIALPGGHYPAVPDDDYSTATIKGWSKGYTEFVWNAHLRTLTPWFSADGLRWQAGPNLDLAAWAADFAAWDAVGESFEPGEETLSPEEQADEHDSCSVRVHTFEDGGAALYVGAYLECGGVCGSPDMGPGALWTSPNGLEWTALDPKKAFGSATPESISGGSSGFITLASANGQLVNLHSADGRAWTQGSLPGGAVSLSAPVSFAGGFVLAGAVVVVKGHQGWTGAVCGTGWPYDLSKFEGALWWSPDGASWTRDTLTGTAGYGVEMSVSRIDDHTLLADETTSNAAGDITGEIQWLSHDGKSWARLKGTPVTSDLILSGHDHGLIVDWPADPSQEVGVLRAFDGLQLITLSQSGDLPWWAGSELAIGPTGLLASDNGRRFWIGVPSA